GGGEWCWGIKIIGGLVMAVVAAMVGCGGGQGWSFAAKVGGDGWVNVLDDSCIKKFKFGISLMGKAKDVFAIPNLPRIISKEGFQNVKLSYLGGMWDLFEFDSLASKEKFLNHSDAWFPNFQEEDQDDLFSDGESQEGDVTNKADNNESDVDRVSKSSFMHENDTAHKDVNIEYPWPIGVFKMGLGHVSRPGIGSRGSRWFIFLGTLVTCCFMAIGPPIWITDDFEALVFGMSIHATFFTFEVSDETITIGADTLLNNGEQRL
nr:RNA-directed DNA polymerase, eukaryota, nucleotide-binding alpha-beta plait domain protein [Tanacetum cinerariifolium]GEW43270.1 RNA-directed DNA polymerase, eukaryota, nucleotide-binding alpha-beta plait domain protein [Tanacetum cinerariifolium]